MPNTLLYFSIFYNNNSKNLKTAKNIRNIREIYKHNIAKGYLINVIPKC